VHVGGLTALSPDNTAGHGTPCITAANVRSVS
jgi:hypothetical protein